MSRTRMARCRCRSSTGVGMVSRGLFSFALVLVLVGGNAAAQDQAGRVSPRRPWSISVILGGVRGGPAHSLADQLRAAGFDETRPAGCAFIFCSGAKEHPSKRTPSIVSGLKVRYFITPKVELGLSTSKASLGGSTGYRVGTSGFGDYLVSDWEVATYSLSAYFYRFSKLYVGGGPAYHRLTGLPVSNRYGRFGVTAEVGWRTAPGRRTFLEAAVTGHLVKSRSVLHESVILEPNWNYLTLTVGFGVRL